MEISTVSKNGFCVLRIGNDLDMGADLTELKEAIGIRLLEGNRNIALSLTRKSLLSSTPISEIVQCLRMIKEKGGKLAVIESNQDMLDTFRVIGLDKMITLCMSEDELIVN